MDNLTRDDLRDLLGDIDDLDASRIIATGATLDEVSQALGTIELEDEMGEPAPPPHSPKVSALRSLLEEILQEDITPEEGRGRAR